MNGVCILGSTGSIGLSTLDVINRHPEQFSLVAITANRNVEQMKQQCLSYAPKFAVMADESAACQLAEQLLTEGCETEVLAGKEGLNQVAAAKEVDYVMAAIVGAAGLLPTLSAAKAGKRILLANKEALVMSGQLFIDTIHESSAELLPIDSEHNAIFQCMPLGYQNGLARSGVKRILLTASGGPFRTTPLEQLVHVTPDQACAHPNWDMGRKISVDSATMMNKGLEVIEACWLFNTNPDLITVLLHPESVIHSMVQYSDGSVLAQLGNPDMRTPIAHAMAWPNRIDSGVEQLDMVDVAQLNFEAPDLGRFPCLRLAAEAMRQGGTATAILNAANEIAVEAFLHHGIRFTDIPKVVETALENVDSRDAGSLQSILEADQLSREFASGYIRELAA